MGECFFWYRHTRVVPDKRPLDGCVCEQVIKLQLWCKKVTTLIFQSLTLTVIHVLFIEILRHF